MVEVNNLSSSPLLPPYSTPCHLVAGRLCLLMAEVGKMPLTETILGEIGAPLDLQIRQIALSIQKSCAKNAKPCVYYSRETARGSICDSALARLLKRTPSPWHRMND